MKRCLADVNVLFPLLIRHHEHHEIASQWFNGLEAGEAALCRFVQLALIRLLGNRAILARAAIPASAAWDLIERLLEDERLEFADEPALLGAVMPGMLSYPVPTNKLVADAYLASFAIASSMRFVTLDRGFEQFRGLDLALLIS